MFTFIVISLSDCSFRAVLRNLSHPKIFKLLYSYMCLIIFFKYFNFDSSSLSQGAEVTKQTEPGLSGLVATGLPWLRDIFHTEPVSSYENLNEFLCYLMLL